MTHDWLLKHYRRKLSENGMDPATVELFKLHSPRIIGTTTLFASGKSDMHLKSEGRWAGDIAFIYARFCPEMDREAVRAMGQTDASPFMECADSHWVIKQPPRGLLQKTQTTKFPDLAVVARTPFWSFCAGQRRIGPGQITDGT